MIPDCETLMLGEAEMLEGVVYDGEDIPFEMAIGTADDPDPVKTQSVRFEKRGEQLAVIIKGTMRSWPKSRWSLALEFLDDQGGLKGASI